MILIKEKYKDRVIGFGGKGKTPLGKYSEKDLIDLAVLARSSGCKDTLELFAGNLPPLSELQILKVRLALTNL